MHTHAESRAHTSRQLRSLHSSGTAGPQPAVSHARRARCQNLVVLGLHTHMADIGKAWWAEKRHLAKSAQTPLASRIPPYLDLALHVQRCGKFGVVSGGDLAFWNIGNAHGTHVYNIRALHQRCVCTATHARILRKCVCKCLFYACVEHGNFLFLACVTDAGTNIDMRSDISGRDHAGARAWNLEGPGPGHRPRHSWGIGNYFCPMKSFTFFKRCDA